MTELHIVWWLPLPGLLSRLNIWHQHVSPNNGGPVEPFRTTNEVLFFVSLVSDTDDGRSHVSMEFHLSGMTSRETTHLAELRIRPTSRDSGGRRRSRLQRLKVTVYQGGVPVRAVKLRVRLDHSTADGFDVIELTRLIQEVTVGLSRTNDTRVEVTIRDRRPQERDAHRTRRSRGSRVLTPNDAHLVVYSEDRDFFRSFRRPPAALLRGGPSGGPNHEMDAATAQEYFSRFRRDADSKNKRGPCSLQDMVVDFDEIGWGRWIIYPKQFNAHQCSGKCTVPVIDAHRPTNHAILQSVMRLHKPEHVDRPCCAVTDLGALSVLYHEYGEIVVRRHQGMVGRRCGCR